KEDGRGLEVLHHRRERRGQKSREDPVDGTSERLSRGPVFVGEDFRDEHPDHRALSNRRGGEACKSAGRDDGKRFTVERPSREPEGEDVAERTDVEERPPAEAVNEPEPDKGEHEVRHADPDRLEEGRFLPESGQLENARGEIEYGVDAGELIE